jgi:hypothetical protein
MLIILSLAGDGISDDLLARLGYRQVARISGKEVVRIFGTRKGREHQRVGIRICPVDKSSVSHRW